MRGPRVLRKPRANRPRRPALEDVHAFAARDHRSRFVGARCVCPTRSSGFDRRAGRTATGERQRGSHAAAQARRDAWRWSDREAPGSHDPLYVERYVGGASHGRRTCRRTSPWTDVDLRIGGHACWTRVDRADPGRGWSNGRAQVTVRSSIKAASSEHSDEAALASAPLAEMWHLPCFSHGGRCLPFAERFVGGAAGAAQTERPGSWD